MECANVESVAERGFRFPPQLEDHPRARIELTQDWGCVINANGFSRETPAEHDSRFAIIRTRCVRTGRCRSIAIASSKGRKASGKEQGRVRARHDIIPRVADITGNADAA